MDTVITCWKFSYYVPDIDEDEKMFRIKRVLKEWSDPKSHKWAGHCAFGHDQVVRSGIYREGGFAYDLTPVLRKFLVRKSYDAIYAYYAPNKTTLRKTGMATSKEKIIECPKDF